MSNNSYEKLYRQSEHGFLSSISKKFKEFGDVAVAYTMGMPEADANFSYIKKDSDNLKDVIEQVKLFYKNEDVPFVITIPEDICPNIETHLIEVMKFKYNRDSMFMGMSLKNDIKIQNNDSNVEIKDANDDMLDWLAPIAGTFEIPIELGLKFLEIRKEARGNSDTHNLVLYCNNEPVSSTTLFIEGNVSRIDDVATLMEFRGRGYGSKIVNSALVKAKEKGVEYCFLEATNAGLSIYKKLGFDCFYNNRVYSFSESDGL